MVGGFHQNTHKVDNVQKVYIFSEDNRELESLSVIHRFYSAGLTVYQQLHQESGTTKVNIPQKAISGLAPSTGTNCNSKGQLPQLLAAAYGQSFL